MLYSIVQMSSTTCNSPLPMASINNCSNDQFGEVNNTRSPQRRVLFNSISESLCVLLVGVGFNNTRLSKNRVIMNSIFAKTSYSHDVYCFNSTRLLYKRVTCNSILEKPSTDQPLHTPHPPNFLGPLANYIWHCRSEVWTWTSLSLQPLCHS